MALLMSIQQSAPSAGSEGSSGNAFKLREKLNELLANLREEQRLESEHHHAIFREILSPLQVSLILKSDDLMTSFASLQELQYDANRNKVR